MREQAFGHVGTDHADKGIHDHVQVLLDSKREPGFFVSLECLAKSNSRDEEHCPDQSHNGRL